MAKDIKLGDKVKSKVNGFTGIAIGKSEWLNGCIRFTVQPDGLDKEGKSKPSESFDVEELDLVKTKAVQITPQRTGGPMPSASRRADAGRR